MKTDGKKIIIFFPRMYVPLQTCFHWAFATTKIRSIKADILSKINKTCPWHVLNYKWTICKGYQSKALKCLQQRINWEHEQILFTQGCFQALCCNLSYPVYIFFYMYWFFIYSYLLSTTLLMRNDPW